MAQEIWIAAIWLIGYVVGYFTLKGTYIDYAKEWTTGDRAIVLFLALFSWISVLAAIIVSGIVVASESNKPAKW